MLRNTFSHLAFTLAREMMPRRLDKYSSTQTHRSLSAHAFCLLSPTDTNSTLKQRGGNDRTRWVRKPLPEHHRILPFSTCQSHSEPARLSVLGFRTHERAEWGMSEWRHLSKVQTERGEEPLLDEWWKSKNSDSPYLKTGHAGDNSLWLWNNAKWVLREQKKYH